MTNARVRVEPDGDPAARDRYVREHPLGTPFHLSAWGRAVHRAFGHRALDLVAMRDGAVAGVLPLTLVRHLLFGRQIVSSAFAVYGGPLADGEETRAALLTEGARIAGARRVRRLEVRCRADGPEDWPGKDLYVTFRGPIGGTDEELLLSLPKETRRMVRRSLAEGFVPRTGPGDLGAFYRLFAEGYRDHGTPVFPIRWIRSLLEEFGEEAVLFSLTDGEGGAVAASVLTLLFRDEVLPYYIGAARDCYRRNVNNAVYFELMRWARDERGASLYDFGRSKKGTGSHSFKKRWGLEEVPLDYRFHLVTDREVPDLNPLNPKYARRIAAWRKLPLWLANRLGPPIVRGLP